MFASLALSLALGCSPKPAETGAPAPGFSAAAIDVEGGALLSVWSRGNEVWMAGGQLGGGVGLLARYGGDTLCVEREAAEKTFWWIHGDDAGWVAVGEHGLVLREADGVRTREDIETDATLFGVWVDGDEVIAVGGTFTADGSVGEVWRSRHGEWTAVATGLPGAVFKVWNGFVVGDGVAYRYADGELTPIELGGGRLLTVRGRDDGDVYAVGGLSAPEMLHFDGASWTDVDARSLGQPLNGVWTAPGEDVWVAGNFGVVAGLVDGVWTIPGVPLTADHLHAVWKTNEEVLFVGGNLFDAGEKHGVVLRYGLDAEPIEVTDCASQTRRADPARSLAPLAPPGLPASLPLVGAAFAAEPVFPSLELAGPAGLVDLREQPAVVNLWASWCAPCLAELPLLDQLSARLSGIARVVAVSVDATWGPASGVVARLGLKLPLAHDPTARLPRALATPSLPATYVVDAHGRVRGSTFRALTAADVAALEAQVRALRTP